MFGFWNKKPEKVFESDTNSLQNPYKEFSFTINAFQTLDFYYCFNFVTFIDLNNAESSLLVRFGKQGHKTTVRKDLTFRLDQITDRIEIQNTSASALSIKIGLGVGDASIAFSSVAVSSMPVVDVNIISSITLRTQEQDVFDNAKYKSYLVDTTPVLIRRAADNREVIIQNLDVQKMWIGFNSAVTTDSNPATQGYVLRTGDTLRLNDCGCDIYAISNLAFSAKNCIVLSMDY